MKHHRCLNTTPSHILSWAGDVDFLIPLSVVQKEEGFFCTLKLVSLFSYFRPSESRYTPFHIIHPETSDNFLHSSTGYLRRRRPLLDR